MSKHFITITDENLYNDIVEYCKLNNEKVNNFCQRILKEKLLMEKYGDTPFNISPETSWKSNPESKSFVDPYIPDFFIKTKERMDKMEPTNIVVETKEIVEPEYTEEKNNEIEDAIKNKKIRRL